VELEHLYRYTDSNGLRWVRVNDGAPKCVTD
jgi:hypothetical protein